MRRSAICSSVSDVAAGFGTGIYRTCFPVDATTIEVVPAWVTRLGFEGLTVDGKLAETTSEVIDAIGGWLCGRVTLVAMVIGSMSVLRTRRGGNSAGGVTIDSSSAGDFLRTVSDDGFQFEVLVHLSSLVLGDSYFGANFSWSDGEISFVLVTTGTARG